jgi:hypothetical protein
VSTVALFSTVSAEDMRSAQIITLATLALWIGVGVVPPLRPHARGIRIATLALYLVGCAGFVVYVTMAR